MNRLNIGLGLALGISSLFYFSLSRAFIRVSDDNVKCSRELLGFRLCKEANGKYARCEDAKFDLSACIFYRS